MKYLLMPSFILLLIPVTIDAQTIILHKKDAVVYAQEQIINGEVDSIASRNGTLFVNDNPVDFTIPEPGIEFTVPFTIGEGENNIYVIFDSDNITVSSDTITLTLGFNLRPEVYVFAEVSERTAILRSQIIENPKGSSLAFNWRQDEANPQQVNFSAQNDSTLSFTFSESAASGEYYFAVEVTTPENDTVTAETYITVNDSGTVPFNIKRDHADWIDRAIIYQITPYNFVQSGRFDDITSKLPEIAGIGINTIWLQPVYGTAFRGQGYDIADYFSLRTDLGTEEQLRELIQTAKSLGLRVLFDFVPNHTSIEHSYAKDAIRYGTDSHYYNYYQPIKGGVPYSMHYNQRTVGEMTFNYYFWDDLPNLNYDNPEVQRMMIEAGKLWIEKFDIDGYRIDAVWGTNARNPEFMKKWRLALKRIKPDILLLGEDKATDPTGLVFDERFDVAYDWAPEEAWVSHWVWQTFYSASTNPTIFNHSTQSSRVGMLRNSLTNFGNGYHPRAKILRFMENNDTFRFLETHDLARTKMVATMMFSLHGIPLMYQGQEIGFNRHPYSTSAVFWENQTIQTLDRFGLYPLYQDLAVIRQNYPALYSNNFEEVAVESGQTVFAYRRWQDEQNIFGIINLGNSDLDIALQIPVESLNLDSTKTYYLTDLMNGEFITSSVAELNSTNININKHTTRLFIFADSLIITDVARTASRSQKPETFKLTQNYPNPFNPVTNIHYQLAESVPVRLEVFNLLGQKVATLLDKQHQSRGEYSIQWHGKDDLGHTVGSGLYVYRLEAGAFIQSRKMLFIK